MTLDLVIENVNLVSFCDKDLGLLENTSIGFKDNLIAFIGKNKTSIPTKKTYDGKQQWLLPGFIDCHTHIIYAGNRADEFNLRLNGKTYAEIAESGGGIRSTVIATRNASEQELFVSAKKRIEMLLSEGVEILEIKSGYGLDLSTELKILRVAKQLENALSIVIKKTFLGAHCLPDEFHQPEKYIEFLCEKVLPVAHKEGLVDFVDGFCETIAFTPAQLQPLFETAKQLNIPIKLHTEQLNNIGGSQFAAKFQAISVEHLEHTNESDVKAIAKAGSIAVLLPGAFYFLNETKVPPINLFRKYKVPMAIATDSNPGSSPSTSILLMLNMACVLLKLTPIEALRGITINAAKALRLSHIYGTLEVGKSALCHLWDISHPFDLVYNFGYKPKHQSIRGLL